jgi:type I restriction enzyme M protein
MTSTEIRRQIELVWEEFWRAGLYDTVEIIEQILYLLFLRRLDDLEAGAPRLSAERPLRWSHFRQLRAAELSPLLADHVFPHLRRLGGPGSAYAQHLKDVRFSVPTAALATVVKLLEALPRVPAEGSEDPYDYVADKLARLGRRGDFHTPRHVERLMVALVAPNPGDVVCSPVSGTGNFLVATAEYLARRYPALPNDPAASEHFHHRMFHAYDADKTMLRIACMNMALSGVRNPNIRYTNTIAPDIDAGEDRYSVILAHPSTASLPDQHDRGSHAQAEVLMVAQFVRMLKPGGRAAIIVPQHILSGSSNGAPELRQILVHEQRLDAVIKLPPKLFNTACGGRKSILLFTRTDCGGSGDLRHIHPSCRAQLRTAQRSEVLHVR